MSAGGQVGMPPTQLFGNAVQAALRLRTRISCMNLVRMQLAAGEHPIDARVARTDEQRALGLMHRVELAPNEGMLFMCDEAAVQKFWMKDTPVALSIAFLEEDGTILHLDDLEPFSLESR